MKTWTPESPFLEAPSFSPEQTEETQPTQYTPEFVTPWISAETPFLRDAFETQGIRGVEQEAMAELLAELRDEAFEPSVYQLVARANDYLGDRFQGEFGASEAEAAEAERQLEAFFGPMVREGESMFERLADGAGRHDLTAYSEAELEALLDQYAPVPATLEPQFEQFLGKVFKKASRLVKGAVNFAKKGLSTLAKAGLGPLLRKIGKLFRPLVKRIIRFAMNRLPAGVRPIAQRIASRLLGAEVAEAEAPSAFPNAASAEAIQQEFDLQLLSLLSEEGEREAEQQLYEYEHQPEAEADVANPAAALEAAKAQFVDQFARLQPGQDVTPVVQQFIPAALMAVRPLLKVAGKVIGRPKIVNFLSGLIAKLIQRWVGQNEARMLASALADTGLSLLGFEAPTMGGERLTAAEMVAETVERTLLEAAQLPEHVLENDVILEGMVREAFEHAAAAYFPDPVIRPELRETAGTPGVWAPMPRNRKRKYYRKYTRIMDVEITPQVAAGIKVFGGATLADFFRDVLLLSADKTVRAKAHLYELTIGSRLPDIAHYERQVPGLGSYDWDVWSQIQPLTPEAALALFREPGLGKAVDPLYLAGPYLTGIGQRFYFLQIPGLARPWVPPKPPPKPPPTPNTTPIPPPPPAETCRNAVGVTLNLGGARVMVRFQFSERTTQEIAQALKRGDAAGAWRIAKSMDNMLREAIRSRRANLNVIGFEVQNYAAGTGEEFQAAAAGGAAAGGGVLISLVAKALEKILDKLIDVIWEAFAAYFRNTAQEFIRAAEDPADGVTFYLSFVNIPILSQIRNFREQGWRGLTFPSLDMSIPRPSMSAHAGCNR